MPIKKTKRVNLASGGRLMGQRGRKASFSMTQTENAPTDGVTPTKGTPSISGPSQPEKPAPSVEYSQNKLGETRTVSDGNTDVVMSVLRGPSPEAGVLGREKQHYPPCINPSCKSYGHPHPNCLCYAGPGGSSLEAGMFAHGGRVCSGPHKESCEHYADGGEVAENNIIHNDPQATIDHASIHHGLLGLLTKVGHSKSEDPNKHVDDYLNGFRKGNKSLKSHVDNLLAPEKMPSVEHDDKHREALKQHFKDIQANPEKMLETGGNIGHYLPAHGAQLGALMGTAQTYFNSIKPVQSKQAPLDELMPADKQEIDRYNRQIDIAQNPLIVLHNTKDGTLTPRDVQTLSVLYPKLYKNIVSKGMESLVNAKTRGIEIPYKRKQALSLLLGQPLDSTMTPQAMQAIIQSQAQQQSQQQQKKEPKKASGVEIKQVDKVSQMYESPSERRESRRD